MGLYIVGFIVIYCAYCIHHLGIQEQKAIKAHKDRMRQENELEISRFAAEVAAKYHD